MKQLSTAIPVQKSPVHPPPAITTTTSISDAAKIMTAWHLRHLPVAGDTGILGIVDITDVCQALISAGQG